MATPSVAEKSSSNDAEGEVYTKPDGTVVRRVKRSTSNKGSGNSLGGFLSSGGTQRVSGSSRSVGNSSTAGEGEIYIRPDGKKVRRVKRSVGSSSVADIPSSSSTAVDGKKNKNLDGFLSSNGSPMKIRSASVGGHVMVKDPDVYIRADGKKVRRVKKPASSSSLRDGSDPLSPTKSPTKSSDVKQSSSSNLSVGLPALSSDSVKGSVSGSNSVTGDQHLEGEIYVRADGKKVRRVRKPGSGSASLTGAPNSSRSIQAADADVEIYTRPDGTKVRRIRKRIEAKPPPETKPSSETKSPPETAPETPVSPSKSPSSNSLKSLTTRSHSKDSPRKAMKTLEGFLGGARFFRPKTGGSNSVAGDRIAVSKDESLTGEVYVRADGMKVRRVKKSIASPNDNVEIITRPDGTKVRRIRKVNPDQPADGLAGFLDSQPKIASKGSAATVSGKMLASSDLAPKEETRELSKEEKAKKNLDNFLSTMDSRAPRQTGRSASVAGDMIAVNKESSLTGEVYVRADDTKVRRVKKASTSSVQPGDEVEIITRPDGTKVRRIKRVKKPSEEAEDTVGSLHGFIGGPKPIDNASGAASVTGDMLHSQDAHGEVYIRADGKKVRRVRKSAPAVTADGEQYEIYTRPDGKKVRRIRRVKPPDGVSSSSGSAPGPSSVPQSTPVSVPQSTPVSPQSITVAKQPLAVQSGGSGSQGAGVSSLSAGDEDVAAGYRKMLKMGMPDGAVMQKMAVDGVAQHIQDSVIAREAPAPAAPASVPAPAPATMVPVLSPDEEEIAGRYRRMLKMGMPEGAVEQKMVVDGVAQNIQDSVLGNEVPIPPPSRDTLVRTNSTVPAGMALVSKDQATVADGMVLVPQEQAARTQGMVAVRKDQVGGDSVPEGYVLVPKDQVRGDPGKDDLILVRRDQVKSNATVVMINEADASGLKKNGELGDSDIAAIKGANIVDFDDLPSQVEMLKQSADGKKQRFLVQALPDNPELEHDFIRKNLLPKNAASPAPAPAPAPAPKPAKPAQPSSSIAEILAQMSKMGGDFDAEKMGELLQKLESSEKRQRKLEKQLEQAGVAIAEDIDYEVCLKKVAEIGKRMGEIGGSDVTHPDKDEQNRLREEYFKLEQEMEKYNNALLMTDEYQAEQDRLEKKWETDNAPGNLEALKKLRRHMAVEVRNLSEAQLTTEPTPNGKYLPKAIAKKFKRTNVLQLIRRNPDDIVRMHPSTLENMRVTGMTLTERRAIYEHLRPVGPQWKAMKAEKMTERKWTWYNMMKNNFKENLASWQRHVDQYGPPGNHPYLSKDHPNGCPLIGKQCPLKADKLIDYDGDFGFPDGPEYEVSEVKKADTDDPGAKAMQEALALAKEKKANERSDALKKHYQGKLLQVSKANGSCEMMDDMMDKMEFGMTKWIDDFLSLGDDKSKLTEEVKKKEVANFTDALSDCRLSVLDFCGRSGMQLSGKKGGEQKPDPRSIVECSLCEETAEAFEIFNKFVNNRLKYTGVVDTRIKSTIDMLKGLLTELRERNVKTIADLGGQRLPQSRKLKTQEEIEKDIKDKRAAKAAQEAGESEEAETGGGPPLPGPPRGGLMDAIKAGRGGGGRGGLLDAIKGGRGGGGRGGLLDAIKGGRGGGGGGGRGGLLDAIKAGRGGGGGGGRGGLLDAIKAGRGGGGGGGGRGGLLDAIKAGRGGDGGGGRGGLLDAIKGRGRGGGPPDAGGRGGLLAAIQARGGGGD